MSRLLADDALLDDMAACLYALRTWLGIVAEQHAGMDNTHIDNLLNRYTDETGQPPPRVRMEDM